MLYQSRSFGGSLQSRFTGKLFASAEAEGLRAAISWGDSQFDLPHTACIIHRDNHPSFRVAEKLGYKTLVNAAGDGESHAILVRPRSA
jgi:RimJ/RimL family protein N-acetyltransferase